MQQFQTPFSSYPKVAIFAYDEEGVVGETAEVIVEDVAIEEGAIEVEVDLNMMLNQELGQTTQAQTQQQNTRSNQ